MSYTSMLNEVTQIPHEDLVESESHHSLPSSSDLSAPPTVDSLRESRARTRGPAPRPKKLPAERHSDGKLYAKPKPNGNGFREAEVNKIITTILIGFMRSAGCATWAEVDSNMKGQMFKEFMSKIHLCHGFTERLADKAFRRKCSTRFRERKCRIQGGYKPPKNHEENQLEFPDQPDRPNHPDQPDRPNQPDQPDPEERPIIMPTWVLPGTEMALLEHWGSKAFDKVSVRNKRSRDSVEGCSIHTGGSITLEDHMRIMEHNAGGPVPIARVFERIHTNQIVDGIRLHDDEPKPWPNPKHRKIHEAYEEKKG